MEDCGLGGGLGVQGEASCFVACMLILWLHITEDDRGYCMTWALGSGIQAGY